MHKLERRALEEAQRLEEDRPEVLSATEHLCTHMLYSDWETLYSINLEVEQWPSDLIDHFNDLLTWVLDGPCVSDSDSYDSEITRGEKEKEAARFSKQLIKLSRLIGETFPELCEPYSLLKVISPWKYATEPFTVGGSTSTRDAEDHSRLDECETKAASKEPSINSSQSKSHEEDVYSAREIFFELTGSWSHVENVVRRRRCHGFEVPVAGENSVLKEIAEYVTKTTASMSDQPPRRKYPVWCRLAASELWQRINNSLFFRPASDTQKYRIIEYSIFAYSDYHSLELPGEGWGGEANQAGHPLPQAQKIISVNPLACKFFLRRRVLASTDRP